ncbi:16615_t:CDS:1, partial [Funneliformis caledonium]
IFNSTHSELSTMQSQMEELQTIYQSDEPVEIAIPYKRKSCLTEIIIEPP